MARLRNSRMEEFCRLIAHEDLEPSEACFRAGYGVDQHPKRDSYHAMQAARLMTRKDVVIRIQELRDHVCIVEKDKRETMIETLYKIVNYNPTKYMKVYQTALEDGRLVQATLLRKEFTDFTKWDPEDLKLIDHFDSKTGNPVFMDKKWAFEKLLKILQLDGSKQGVDIEDILSLFSSAGLRLGRKEDIEAMMEQEEENEESEDEDDYGYSDAEEGEV